MAEYKLEGWEDLIENLNKLSARAQKNVLRGALRAEAHVIRDAIKENAPILQPGTKNPHERYPGQMRDSVIAVDVNIANAAAAGVKIAGSSESLAASKSAARAFGKGKLKSAAAALTKAIADGYFWRWVEYGSPHNTPPNPFVRRGWDGKKTGSLGRIAESCRARLGMLTHD